MNQDYAKLLLQDEGMVRILKEMIVDKANYYDQVSKKILTEKEINNLLAGKVQEIDLKRIFEHYISKEEEGALSRELSSMCFYLNRARGRINTSKNWETQYSYARNIVSIESVASSLLGVANFSRNIKCPFHEDSTPSLKIYSKNNYFICFGCGARGSPIDFVMKYKNCPFKEAVLYLSNL